MCDDFWRMLVEDLQSNPGNEANASSIERMNDEISNEGQLRKTEGEYQRRSSSWSTLDT